MASTSFRRFTAVNGKVTADAVSYEITFLHNYRALLRAATYLPDSLARQRVHNEIKARFRKRFNSRTSHIADELKMQRQVLKLQRAADLRPAELSSILKWTYGRSGPQRRRLVTALVAATDAIVPEVSKQPGSNDTSAIRSRVQDIMRNPMLVALLKSQRMEGAHLAGRKIKSLQPEIPKQNIWMRKTPVKVAVNIEKKWLTRTLSIACPPLPEDEWRRLQALSMGMLREKVPRRRTLPQQDEDSKSAISLNGLTGRVNGGPSKRRSTLDSRGLRQLYSQIWSRTPLLTYDDTNGEWSAKWGHSSTVSKAGIDTVRIAEGAELELFEGLDTLRADVNAGPPGSKKDQKK